MGGNSHGRRDLQQCIQKSREKSRQSPGNARGSMADDLPAHTGTTRKPTADGQRNRRHHALCRANDLATTAREYATRRPANIAYSLVRDIDTRTTPYRGIRTLRKPRNTVINAFLRGVRSSAGDHPVGDSAPQIRRITSPQTCRTDPRIRPNHGKCKAGANTRRNSGNIAA